MVTKKSICVLLVNLAISFLVLGSSMQARAEIMNYKSYVWMNKQEKVPVDDVKGHEVILAQRGGFYVLENGEIATIRRVSMNDLIKGAGSAWAYETITFADGSTIIAKYQANLTGTGAGAPKEIVGEIIKGTGRFEGIKGTQRATAKFVPAAKGDAGTKLYGEGTITYTLPSK